MSETITIRGFVATEITSSTTPGGVATASFRIGSTTRRFDPDPARVRVYEELRQIHADLWPTLAAWNRRLRAFAERTG